MENLSGCLTARLADNDETYESGLIDEINRNINPPRPVAPGEVYIRAMYLVSDQVNSQGGCFAEEELDRLARLLIDSPVMVGHRRDSLPLARSFKASKISIEGRSWIKSYFYWLRDNDSAEDLKNNIDGGIYKECSVSFLFSFPECSICGEDIRNCRHVPFREYEIEPGRKEIAHFKYRKIEKVLETSLVFRGSIPETKITDRLSSDSQTAGAGADGTENNYFSKKAERPVFHDKTSFFGKARINFVQSDDFGPVKSESALFVYPHQPGLLVRVNKRENEIALESTHQFPDNVRQDIIAMLSRIKAASFVADFLLYATRGKDRLNGFGLAKAIGNGKSSHRLKLKLCDMIEINGETITGSIDERWKHIEDILRDSACSTIETLSVRRITLSDCQAIVDECENDKYKYGPEVLIEEPDRTLKRCIIVKNKIIPAIIERLIIKSRSHFCCDFKTIGDGSIIKNVICPKAVGMDEGTVVLLADISSKTNKSSISCQPVDLMLGTETTGIIPADLIDEKKVTVLYACSDRKRLLFQFRHSGTWRPFVVHNFMTPLLLQGRRFVADELSGRIKPEKKHVMRQIALRSVTCLGKLVILKPAEKTTLFGDTSGLCLCPVLIDGAERYLFYSNKAIDHQEEP